MSEGIIKSGRKQSFTVLYKSAIEDKRLPLDARGLLAIIPAAGDQISRARVCAGGSTARKYNAASKM